MRRILASLTLLTLLAGCATGPSFSERMSTLVGRSEAELVAALGVPVRTYETGGVKFLQFEQRRTVVYPGDPFWPGPWGYGWYYPYSPPTYGITFCDVTFALRGQRVESFTYRGSCR